ncbi:hypothetical protein [Microbacterium sp. nov. GSS16]|uniref:hypothetical protein n=1 Tax=Microbacterium sp. nov. GSS16 TaxID=3019890 RepID=UPI00230681ED|nr:hypothetical protein [Microbacterium sp. nov. GSS16]WCD93232.1 hypothetical protein PGB26_02840 [Microbacterium sp. nov. GSS16]
MSSTSDAADVADASRADVVRADAVRGDAVRAAAESRAIVAAGLGGLSGLIGGLIVFAGRLVGLADGALPVGSFAALVAGIVGIPVFAITYVRADRRRGGGREVVRRSRLRRAIDVIGLTLTASAMVMLLIAALFSIAQLAFRYLEIEAFAAAVLTAGAVAASTYALSLLASDITTQRVATLLALFLAAGTLSSMLSAEDELWWQNNFSALGMRGVSGSYSFNVTVILSGLVLITLSGYLTRDLRVRSIRYAVPARGVGIVRTLLVIVGVAFMGVGAVPVDVSQLLHNTFSIGLIIAFVALIAACPTLIAGLPRAFIAASAVFVAGMVLIVLLWVPFGYYNLTAVELLAVVVVFTWLVLFTRNVSTGQMPDGDARLDA